MKKRTNFNRFVAIIVAIVMVFSLAVFDANFGSSADEPNTQGSSLTIEPELASSDYAVQMTDYIYAKSGETFELLLNIKDGNSNEEASNIKKVTYNIDGGGETEITASNDEYRLEVSTAGTYTFTLTDSSDLEATASVVVMYSNDFKLGDVTVDSSSEISTDGYLTSSTADEIKVTVNATRDSIGQINSDAVYAPLKLVYTLLTNGTSPSTNEAGLTSTDGSYSTTVTIPKSTAAGVSYQVVMYVCDASFSDIKTYAFDENGTIVFIDSDAPEVSISDIKVTTASGTTAYNSLSDYSEAWCSEISFTAKATENYSTISSAKITGAITDEATSINSYEYSFSSNTINSGIDSLSDGEYEINFTATNYLGLTSAATSIGIKLDRTAPEIEVSNESGTEIDADSTYYIDSASGESISFDAADALSGVNDITVKVDGVQKTLNSGSLLFDEVGTYKVEVIATDNAGNKATEEFTVVVDNEAPEIGVAAYSDYTTLDVTGSDLVYVNGSEVKVVFTISGYDIDVDDTDAEVLLDGKATTEGSTYTLAKSSSNNQVVYTYTLKENGTYDFNITAESHYTKLLTEKELNVLVYDTGSPSISDVEFSSNKTYKANDGVTYFDEYPTITFDTSDEIALDSITIKDTSGNTIATKSFAKDYVTEDDTEFTLKSSDGIKENTLYTIYFNATDKAGNSYDSIEYQFVIDTTAPTNVNVSSVSYWNKSNVSITASATDNNYLSSIKAVATCNGTVITKEKDFTSSSSGSATFTYSSEGVYKVTVYAYDEVGNCTTTTSSFVIDKSSPVVSYTGIPSDGIYANNSSSPITVNVTDTYGISADDVLITLHMETYDGTTKSVVISGTNTNSKTVTATVKTCEVIDNKPMKYYFTVSATDESGNSASSTSSTFYYDKWSPELTISPDIAGTGTVYYNSSVNFSIGITEQFALGATIYILDAGDYSKSSSEADYASKAYQTFSLGKKLSNTFNLNVGEDGTYNWVVVAVDASGNEIVSKELDFIIDTDAPVATVEGVPSNKLSTGTRVKITITDNEDIDASQFTVTQCYKYYDSDEYIEKNISVFPADSNTVYASVYCGEKKSKACTYYFNVTGTDKAGNKVEYTVSDSRFMVDSTLPDITVSPLPEGTNDGYYNSAVSFKLTVEEQFDKKTKITIKDAYKATNKDDDESYVQEATSKTYNVKRSGEGTYKLVITAEDAFGNETKETVSFIIDKTKPVATISNVSRLNNSSVSLDFDLSDNYKGKSYTISVVRKDSSGNVVYDKTTKKSWSTSGTSTNMTFSDEGDYEVSIFAVDKAGNISSTDSVSFRIDKTAPVLSISGVEDAQAIDCTAVLSVDEAFSFSYEDTSLSSSEINATITKKTDGTAESTVATLSTSDFSSGNPHTASYSFSEDGEYTITFTAKDLAGNTAATVTKTFKVDKTAPEISVTAVNSANSEVSSYDVIGGVTDSFSDYVDMDIVVTEAFYATNNVTISVLRDGVDVSDEYFSNFSSSSLSSKGSQRFEEDGVYTINIAAEDELGNKSEEYNLVFTIDNTAPTLDATDKMKEFISRETDDGALLLNYTDFEDIMDMGYDALWDVNDTSVFNVVVKLDGVDFVDFTDLTDGYHTMTITVTDELGHESYQEFSFTYDGTAPRIIITGVEDGSTVRDSFTMTISLEDEDDFITSIVINGETIDPSLYEDTNTYEYQVTERGDYEVLVYAEDTAGNQASTYDSETGEVFSFQLKGHISVALIVVIIILILLIIAAIIFIITRKRKEEEQ